MNERIRELGEKAGVCPIRHAGGGEWRDVPLEMEEPLTQAKEQS